MTVAKVRKVVCKVCPILEAGIVAFIALMTLFAFYPPRSILKAWLQFLSSSM